MAQIKFAVVIINSDYQTVKAAVSAENVAREMFIFGNENIENVQGFLNCFI